MDVIEIGRTGRPHGLKGELGLVIDEIYLEDLESAKALLIGQPPIPYFVERLIGGGKLRVKLENFDSREAVSLLANRPVSLPAEQVTVSPETAATPYDELIGYTIVSAGYPDLPPIEDIIDLPEHYLAGISWEKRSVYIPLHPDLIEDVDEERRIVQMNLPQGLLDLR
jgi:16S rRNA processing protein RimM